MNNINAKPQINIKWTYGEPYEKTHANQKNPFQVETQKNEYYKNKKQQEINEKIQQIKNFAVGESNIKQLEREFINTNEDPEVIRGNIARETFQKKQNKRDDNNNKMLERDLISQTSQNPFLTTNNYVDDLTIQDEFLKPKNSSFHNRDII